MRIEIMTQADPQALSMLQAFYSRSPKPIRKRLEEYGLEHLLDPVQNDPGFQKLREKTGEWFFGYGHRSVGQLGYFTLFIEDVSMFVAKAIQHSPLYDGQEVSTRYVDWSNQEAINVRPGHANAVRDFYKHALPIQTEWVKSQHQDCKDDPLFEKTAKAQAFDVLRGFLPFGFKTSLSWTTNFDNCLTHISELRDLGRSKAFHNTQGSELTVLCDMIVEALHKHFPETMRRYEAKGEIGTSKLLRETHTLHQPTRMYGYTDSQAEAEFVRLPHGAPPMISFCGELDIGSWRDLARHRNGMVVWPFHSELGSRSLPSLYHNYYIDSLAPELREFGKEIEERFKFGPSWYERTLSTTVPVRALVSQDQFLYLCSLRRQKTVHQTLRMFMQNALCSLRRHDDKDPALEFFRADLYRQSAFDFSNWTLKRGSQDVVKVK